MSDRRYPQVLRAVSQTPWAIRAEKWAVIREILSLRAAGERFSAEEIEARIGGGPLQKQGAKQSGTVAIIPIYGVIMPRASMFEATSSTGTSVQGFTDALQQAVADPSIGAILLDVDSPGGMTDLIPEAAAQIRGARGSKPIVAIANTDAASAAYWLAASADELVVTPSGMVGSIGVFAAHDDVSAQQEMDGVKTTLISAGKFKTESNPFEPLSDEARQAIQDRVDAFYSMFTRDVAKGRGTTVDAVRTGFGEGRIVTATDALKMGMVDRIDTFEATVERLIVQAATGKPGKSRALAAASEPPGDAHDELDLAADSGLSFAQTALDLRDRADQLTADAGALRALTAAKRDALSLVAESLTGSVAALVELVASTDPARHLPDGHRAHLEFIRSGLT